MVCGPNCADPNMYGKISGVTRLYYLIISILLFFIGLVLLMFFFMMITVPFGLAAWAWAGIFAYLAMTGRPYSDFKKSLGHRFRRRYRY